MIREFLTFITHLPVYYKSQHFNHLAQSISLIARENRCKGHWRAHREASKEIIISSLNQAKHFDSIIIFGPGPLHEIPIDIIALKFKKVVLVDVVHLIETKLKLKRYKNIEFITHDVSEIEDKIALEIKNNKKLLNKIPTAFINQNWGLVISSNLMSQIPLHFEEFIQKKYPSLFSANALDNFFKQLSSDHLSYLLSFNSPALLITDTQTEFYDLKQKIFQTDLNYEHLTLPPPITSWYWDIAPIPEFQKDVGIKMKVEAFFLNSH